MSLNNHLNSCSTTLTIDNCNFLQLIEKEEKRLDLEWQETYREITRIESLINNYTAHKFNLLAKLDTIELKKSDCVKKKTKLIGEMSCLPLPIDDFSDIHRFNSDDDLQNSSLCLRENGSETGSNSHFSMDNIVADLLQTISDVGTGVGCIGSNHGGSNGPNHGCHGGGGGGGGGGSSLGSTGNGGGSLTYERPESSSSVTFSSGSSDYPATIGGGCGGGGHRISSPQSSTVIQLSSSSNSSSSSSSASSDNQTACSPTTTGLDHHSNLLHHRNNNNNNNNIINNNNVNNNNNHHHHLHHPGSGLKPVTVASIVGNLSGSNSNASSISSSEKNNNINGHHSINNMNNININNNNNNNGNVNIENEESSSTGSNVVLTSSQSSVVVGPPPPRFSTNRSFNTHSKVQYNSVLTLETSSNGYVYKALNDGTVMRYKFGNPADNQTFPGHKDKVKVLVLDSKSQLLYTGCDDGIVRCFNANTGQLCNQFSCDGIVISIDRSLADEYLVFATNKGWIYLVNQLTFKLISSHRTFNWIFAVRNILHPFKDGSKRLLVIPMKHKPTVVEAMSGKILQEIGSATIESRPCLQVNGSIAILASVVDKSDNGTSHINVYDSASNWKCIQLIKKEGLISSMCTHGHDLYVGIKFPSYGHVQCFKWSNRSLYLKWVACIAYVHTLSVMPSDVHNLSLMPSDIVLNGGPDGNVYNTTPNAKGPFFCMNKKCDCKLPFARRKDLDFHYSKLQSS